jgi:hypothetical protein
MLLWVELALLLACIVIGARIGGIGLGTISGLGLLVYVFVFRMPPGGPPGTVLGMIIAVTTALAAARCGRQQRQGPEGDRRHLERARRQPLRAETAVTWKLGAATAACSLTRSCPTDRE